MSDDIFIYDTITCNKCSSRFCMTEPGTTHDMQLLYVTDLRHRANNYISNISLCKKCTKELLIFLNVE